MRNPWQATTQHPTIGGITTEMWPVTILLPSSRSEWTGLQELLLVVGGVFGMNSPIQVRRGKLPDITRLKLLHLAVVLERLLVLAQWFFSADQQPAVR